MANIRAFELFIKKDLVSSEEWQRLEDKIREYKQSFTVEIAFDVDKMEFYLYSQKDLSRLLTKIEDFILKPVGRSFYERESPKGKRIFLRFSRQKNIFDVKEKEEIERGRIINKIKINFVSILYIRLYKVTVALVDEKGEKFYSSYLTFKNPLLFSEFDFKKSSKIKKKSIPGFLKIDENLKLFSLQDGMALFEIFAFPYFSHPVWLPLNNFEFNKHSLIVGQTGVGKSKFIELFIKELSRSGLAEDYRVLVIDPHVILYPNLLDIPEGKVNFDFSRSSCTLFPSCSEPKIATELTILLFKTILQNQFNPKMEQVLKYVIYILFSQNIMSLISLKKFLTELEFRKQVLSNLSESDEYLAHFFDTEFLEIITKFYETAIMPVLVLIDELNFLPTFSENPSFDLERAINDNFLTCFSLSRIFLGERTTRLIAGLIIEQIFLIAQKRTLKKGLILIIDEVSLVENEAMISILSEARKFDLSLFLSQQYLTQISPELLRATLSNVFNYFVFKVSDEDAKILVKNLDIKFPEDFLIKEKQKGLNEEDVKRNLLTTLNPRECLVRVFSEGKFFPCFKAKTLTV